MATLEIEPRRLDSEPWVLLTAPRTLRPPRGRDPSGTFETITEAQFLRGPLALPRTASSRPGMGGAKAGPGQVWGGACSWAGPH